MQAVDRAAHRVAQQAVREGARLDAGVELFRRVERGLAGTVAHQLDAEEQAPAANVADVRVRRELPLQRGEQLRAAGAHAGQQVIAFDHALHRQCGGARHRVAEVGVAVLEHAAAVAQRRDHTFVCEHRADRLVATAQALGDDHQVGRRAFRLHCVQHAGAAHAAHHFVGDPQHAVPITDLAHALEVPGRRRHRAGGGADHGFSTETDHAPWPGGLDRGFEFVEQALGVPPFAFADGLVAVGITRRDAQHVHQQRRELLAPPLIAAHRQRTERVAVVALAPGDEEGALGLADLDEVLARQLERGFHRFGAAADEVDVAQPRGRARRQMLGQLFRRFTGEEAGVCVGELVDLAVQRRRHVRVAMAQARHRGATARIQITLTGRVDQPDPFAPHRAWRCDAQVAMDDVRHGLAAARRRPWATHTSTISISPGR